MLKEEMSVIYSIFQKEEELVNIKSDNVATVVFIGGAKKQAPIVYDTTGVEDVDKAVEAYIGGLTAGCTYRYKFVCKVGNVYFFK